MKMSRRALRMQRNHKRNANKSGLNLTALMDIFTILVFFLMVNQAEVEVQNNDAIQLPASLADNKPAEQVTIMISQQEIGRASCRERGLIRAGDGSVERPDRPE